MSDIFADIEELPLYTERQKSILIRIPWVSAPLSVMASGTIVFLILRDRQTKLKFVYQRLILAMSIMDVIGSSSMSLGGVLTPESLGRPHSHGSIATCQLQGFLLQFPIIVGLYNLSLCTYYYLVICREWTPRRIKESHIEPILHVMAVLYPLGSACFALVFDSFNPMLSIPSWCYFSEAPWDCNRYDDIECIRGKNYFYVELAGAILPTAVAVGGVIFIMFQIWRQVRKQELLMECKYSNDLVLPRRPTEQGQTTPPGPFQQEAPLQSSAASSNGVSYSVTHCRRHTKQAAIQAILYTSAFLFSFTAGIIQAFTGYFVETTPKNRTLFFTTSFLVVLFAPLQGLWNLLIYIRPIYRKIRKQHPEYSAKSVFLSIFLGAKWQPRVTPSCGKAELSGTKSVGALSTGPERQLVESDGNQGDMVEMTLPHPNHPEGGSFICDEKESQEEGDDLGQEA